MRDRELYARILGLSDPWIVADVDLDLAGKRVIVRLGRRAGVSLECPQCGRACPGYDTQRQRWRQLDTCQFETRLEADVPRCSCPEHGVNQVRVPWSKPDAFRFPMAFAISVSSIVVSGVAFLTFLQPPFWFLAMPLSTVGGVLGGIGIIVGIKRKETAFGLGVLGLVLGIVFTGISWLREAWNLHPG